MGHLDGAWGPSKKNNPEKKGGKKARGRLLFAALALGQQPDWHCHLPSKHPIPADPFITDPTSLIAGHD
jgi:hypothetical protein